jgi:hypothetical protein
MSVAGSADRALPTVVLIHGAWGDATGFYAVIRALRDRGFSTVGFAPAAQPDQRRRLLSDPAAQPRRAPRPGRALLWRDGHHQRGDRQLAGSGTCLPQWLDAGRGREHPDSHRVRHLQGSLIPDALRPLPFTNPDGSEGVDLYLDQDLFPEAFAGDVDAQTAGVMAAAQRPWSAVAAAAPSRPRTGPFLPGTCSAPRTAPSRLQRSGSWPSAAGRPFRRCRCHMRRLCRSARGRDTADPDRSPGNDPRCSVGALWFLNPARCWPAVSAHDVLIAVNETVTNSLQHGAPPP